MMISGFELNRTPGGGRQDFTEDGTVDLSGRPVLRSKSGGWRACYYIVGYEVLERMAYYGIASNLVLYLTNKMQEGTVSSANSVTNWVGTVWLIPIVGAYVADAHLGRYWTFVIAAAVYLIGLSLLTLAVSVPGLRPPTCNNLKDEVCEERPSSFQVGVFYLALYITAIGTGGTKPNISAMGADQFDKFEPKERSQKLSFFNWWMFGVYYGTLFANTVLVYVQDNVGWTLGYGLATIGLLISIIFFLEGTPHYRHKLPSESPFTKIIRVLVAAVRKWKEPVPVDPEELYELSWEEYCNYGKHKVDYSPTLRVLDKAAVRSGSTSPWMLCSVTQVEETKQMIKMIPILITTFIPSTMFAQVHTLFIKQGTTLDRNLGPHFRVPPAGLTAVATISMLISLIIYDCYFVPAIRLYTQKPRGITLLQRMGTGMVLHTVIMLIACLVERKRLTVARDNGISAKDAAVPLSIFVLLPQFALMGIADAFIEVAKLEFFYDQAPEGMKSLGTSYFTTGLAVGNFLSSFLLKTVSRMTMKQGHKGWILDNLNISHLDYVYALFTVLSMINFGFFLLVARFYVYNVHVGAEMELDRATETSPSPSRARQTSGSII